MGALVALGPPSPWRSVPVTEGRVFGQLCLAVPGAHHDQDSPGVSRGDPQAPSQCWGFAPRLQRLPTSCSSPGAASRRENQQPNPNFHKNQSHPHPPKTHPQCWGVFRGWKRRGITRKPVLVVPPAPTAGSWGSGGGSERDLWCCRSQEGLHAAAVEGNDAEGCLFSWD